MAMKVQGGKMVPAQAGKLDKTTSQRLMLEMNGIWDRFERMKDQMNRAGVPGTSPAVRAYANATSALAQFEAALKDLA